MSSWKDWNPGLDNDMLTLGDAFATLPGNDPESINFLVRLFENPKSPIAFKGAISLERHDCVHILLGRGLLPQDEAFVIGFTMGTSKKISSIEAGLFEWITKNLYPHPYKMSEQDLVSFRLGLQYGKITHGAEVYEMPLESMMDSQLKDLRAQAGIATGELKAIYRCEQILLPKSGESARLPIAA